MDQVVGAAIMFGIAAAVIGPLAAVAGQEIAAAGGSAADGMEAARKRTGQALAATHVGQYGGTLALHLANVGAEPVAVRAVLLDGSEAEFAVLGQDLAPAGSLAPGGLWTVEALGSGTRVHVVAESGKVFEFAGPGVAP